MKDFLNIYTKEDKEKALQYAQSKLDKARAQENKNDIYFWQYTYKYIKRNY